MNCVRQCMILFARILTTYVNGLSFRAAPSVIKVRVHNLSSTGTEGQYFIHTHTHSHVHVQLYTSVDGFIDLDIFTVFVGVNNVCLCVWPMLLHLLMKFKKQIKLREGQD